MVQDPKEATPDGPVRVIGPGRELIDDLAGLVLAYEKYSHPTKHYRLIWIRGREAWLCAENETRFRKVNGAGGVVEAGKVLAESFGLKFREPAADEAGTRTVTLTTAGPDNRHSRLARKAIFQGILKRLKSGALKRKATSDKARPGAGAEPVEADQPGGAVPATLEQG
jgi:hypothetical protein